MVILKHTSNMSLPLSVRSYIDSLATEFSDADRWTKIAQIAYRLKRGADLLPEFEEDIKRHMEDPQYGRYEDIAKNSIASYIEALRTNNKQDISFILLPEIMSFSKMFQLLTEEIRYRYWEEDSEDNKVECHFDTVHFDYEEMAARYDGIPQNKATRNFKKYISTSKETLRNIEVNKLGILKKNGWCMVAQELTGYTLWSNDAKDERIYPGDAEIIHKFNQKTEKKYQYVVGVPPMPFSGNLLNAKVVILTLNPGYVEDANKIACINMDASEKEAILQLMRGALTLSGAGIYDVNDCSRDQGDHYWEKAFAKLAIEAYGQESTEKFHPIYDEIAFFQLIGYHSEKFKDSADIKHLPSSLFRNLLIKYLVTKTNITFLCLRSERMWKETIGEELWNRLEKEGRIITKGHKGMSQAITPGNLKKDNGFYKLVNILRQE